MIDRAIEHRLFKSVAISIIVSFILFQGFEFAQDVVVNHKEKLVKKQRISPIKVSIATKGNFNIDEERSADHYVKSGDTMLKILLDLGVSEEDSATIFSATKKVFNPKFISTNDLISIKHRVKIEYKESGENVVRQTIVDNIAILLSAEEQVIISRKADGEYEAKKVKAVLSRQISRYSGVISQGLFVDGVNSGISSTSMMNMINLYGYDVDFQRDIHDGDKFEMLVESFYSEDGKKIKDGNVLFSSLTLRNKSIDIYMHKISGKPEYFDAKGNSVRKSLLRTPINGARVSSGFGMRRHPILGYSKMHKGTDFAASAGTPILAAGDGMIVHYGIKGGYGNYVQIKHNADYSTAYGHASRFNRKFHNGSKVRQGEVVAYVGSTGRSTGPHLHFEVLYKGSQINPAKVKATSGLRLGGKELVRFNDSKSESDRYRKNIPNLIKR